MEYRVSGLLGAGAFGITYLARDTHLDKDVAIKEYLPSAFAARAADGSVVPITQQQEQTYRWGLERFSQEARTLARFSHPNIVRVSRYFEANGTGYMVMDYERGESLKAFVRAHPFASEASLKALVAPLLDGLEKVHASGFLHRDIKPDNVFLRQDTGPVLIDFGSARQIAADSGQALTTIVSPGYAPFEQYTTSKQQGPWSDIYSLGGVLYFLVTGYSPPDAITRMKGDTLDERLGEVRERYSAAFLQAITWSLALEESARPRDVATWRNALLGVSVPGRERPLTGQGTVKAEPRMPTIVLQPDACPSPAAARSGTDDSAARRGGGRRRASQRGDAMRPRLELAVRTPPSHRCDDCTERLDRQAARFSGNADDGGQAHRRSFGAAAGCGRRHRVPVAVRARARAAAPGQGQPSLRPV